MCDGCEYVILNFWFRTGLQPAKDFFSRREPYLYTTCIICCKTYARAQDLESYCTRGHREGKKRYPTKTVVLVTILKRRQDEQKTFPTVMWGGETIGEKERNKCHFKYLEWGKRADDVHNHREDSSSRGFDQMTDFQYGKVG